LLPLQLSFSLVPSFTRFPFISCLAPPQPPPSDLTSACVHSHCQAIVKLAVAPSVRCLFFLPLSSTIPLACSLQVLCSRSRGKAPHRQNV
jgi:hypothetical protein